MIGALLTMDLVAGSALEVNPFAVVLSGRASGFRRELEAVGIVDDAIEDGVGIGGIVDNLMPAVDGDLAGDDGRSAAISFFEYLEEIAPGAGVEGLEPQSSRMRS